jgi:hypothetical protein
MLTLDDLYAFRLHYQDISFDEYFIIKKLKEQLYNSGMENEDEINNHIYDFYQKFGFNMSLNEIKSVRTNNLPNTQTLFSYFTNLLSAPINNDTEVSQENDNNNSEQQNTQSNDDENLQNLNYNFVSQTFTIPLNDNIDLNEFINNFNNILNHVLGQPPPQDDIQVTMDHEDINNLKVKIYSENNNTNCSICLCDMEEGDEYFDIKCKHIFHKDCIKKWLEEFNYICPICRTELGKSHAHINSSEESNDINVE